MVTINLRYFRVQSGQPDQRPQLYFLNHTVTAVLGTSTRLSPRVVSVAFFATKYELLYPQ